MPARFSLGLGLASLFLITAASCTEEHAPAPVTPAPTTGMGGSGAGAGGSAPSCDDGLANGDETDVDCGGSCSPCEDGSSCVEAIDCASGFCGPEDGGQGGGGQGGGGQGGGGQGGTGGAGGSGGALVGGAGMGGLGGEAGSGGAGMGGAGMGGAPPVGPLTCQPCGSSDDCAGTANTFCDGGTCVAATKANGDGCTHDGECTSGFCPGDDGICCDAACDGECSACLASKTGGENGVCGAVTAASDPDQECGLTDPTTCGAIGTGCNGDAEAPACNVHPEGTICGSPTCTAGVQRAAPSCDGAGVCDMAADEPCSPYLCNVAGTACETSCVSDGQCESTHFCDGGSCEPRKADGQPCIASNQCTSGFCPTEDGVCCDAACSGECRSCDGAKNGGNAGTCGDIPSGNDPDNECLLSCDGSGACQL